MKFLMHIHIDILGSKTLLLSCPFQCRRLFLSPSIAGESENWYNFMERFLY